MKLRSAAYLAVISALWCCYSGAMAADLPDYLPAEAVEDGPAKQLPDLTRPLYVRHDVPGCVDQDSFNTFVDLLAANQQDAAENVRGCTWLPSGARAVLIDTSGIFDPMVKIAVPTGGETLVVWTSPKCLQNMTAKARRMIRQEAQNDQREAAASAAATKSAVAAASTDTAPFTDGPVQAPEAPAVPASVNAVPNPACMRYLQYLRSSGQLTSDAGSDAASCQQMSATAAPSLASP